VSQKPELIEFDIPYRELGFHGVPGRNNVFLQPTVHCLVNLIEAPFFVLTLDEVEIAYFERVSFGLKQFDLVFVQKDWTKSTVHINAIPIDSLETIKDWLDSCNIKYYEGNISLNWKSVMQKIRDDPKGFWEDGGWDFLEGDDSAEENREEDEESEEDEFVPAGDDDDDGSDESDYGGSDDDSDDYSGGSDDDDSLGSGDDESDEEGEDWDELEKKAVQDDKRRMAKRKRDEDGDDDDDDGKNKKRKK
jgi:nucleosome binding factor SPN SPT16 subunit